MKNQIHFLLGVVLLLLLTKQALAQTRGIQLSQKVNETETFLKQGNAHSLARYFNESVEISIEGKKQNYSRTQAEYVLKDFFAKNPPMPESFEVYHKGKSGELSYLIAKYASFNGNYRVFIKLKGRNVTIDAMDFIKE